MYQTLFIIADSITVTIKFTRIISAFIRVACRLHAVKACVRSKHTGIYPVNYCPH